jgi:hypothetical protein
MKAYISSAFERARFCRYLLGATRHPCFPLGSQNRQAQVCMQRSCERPCLLYVRKLAICLPNRF